MKTELADEPIYLSMGAHEKRAAQLDVLEEELKKIDRRIDAVASSEADRKSAKARAAASSGAPDYARRLLDELDELVRKTTGSRH